MDAGMRALYEDGFTERMARAWEAAKDEERRSGMYGPEQLEREHGLGYLSGCAASYDAGKLESGAYLTDYDHFRLWPFNSWQRIWINDKLTLHYLLAGTRFASYLPEYFFYSTPEGELRATAPERSDATLESVLHERGDIACKPCNGTGSEGFFRLSYADGGYLVNGRAVEPEVIAGFAQEHPNYVFTEFLVPEASMRRIDPLIHTLRTLVVNHHGNDPFIAGTYLRFGMKEVAEKTGAANYTYLRQLDDRDFVCNVAVESGSFGDAKLVYATKVEDAPVHPDSGLAAEGTISCWPEIVELSLGIARHLPLLSVLGFDIGVTDAGPKIMEINSHPGVHYVQLFTPLMADPRFKAFIDEHAGRLAAMDDDARARHWNIRR